MSEAPLGRRSPLNTMTDPVSQLEQVLWPRGATRDVWMIADAARSPRIFPLLLECHLEYACLYSAPVPPALQAAAPYLVQLDTGYPDTLRLLRNAWGQSWGVFLKADTSLRNLRRHLRGFLMVHDPGGRRVVFRYYDPRVLRVYLPTCRRDELNTVFGPIDRFWMEDEQPGAALEFDFSRDRLVQNRRSLEPGAPADPVEDSASGEKPERPRRLPLTIRQVQFDAFVRQETHKFEDWMLDHLHRFFPKQSERAGVAELRSTIRYGIEQAAAYGITTRRDVCKYIDVMLLLGRDFEGDRRYPWAAQILSSPAGQEAKMRAIVDSAASALAHL